MTRDRLLELQELPLLKAAKACGLGGTQVRLRFRPLLSRHRPLYETPHSRQTTSQFKNLCRKHGLTKWSYRRVQSLVKAERTLEDLRVGPSWSTHSPDIYAWLKELEKVQVRPTAVTAGTGALSRASCH